MNEEKLTYFTEEFYPKRKKEINDAMKLFITRMLKIPEDMAHDIYKNDGIENLVKVAEDILININVEVCNPYMNDNKPCWLDSKCKVSNCPFKQ